MAEMEKKDIVRLMVIVGGIIGLVQAITGFFGPILWYNFWGVLYAANIGSSVFGIVVAVLTLLSVFRPGDPIPYSAVFLLIFGVLMTLFNAWFGGIITIVSGILWLVWKL